MTGGSRLSRLATPRPERVEADPGGRPGAAAGRPAGPPRGGGGGPQRRRRGGVVADRGPLVDREAAAAPLLGGGHRRWSRSRRLPRSRAGGLVRPALALRASRPATWIARLATASTLTRITHAGQNDPSLPLKNQIPAENRSSSGGRIAGGIMRWATEGRG